MTEVLSFEEQYGLRIAIRNYIARENISEATKASSLWYATYDEEKKSDIFYFVLDTPIPTILDITHLIWEQEIREFSAESNLLEAVYNQMECEGSI